MSSPTWSHCSLRAARPTSAEGPPGGRGLEALLTCCKRWCFHISQTSSRTLIRDRWVLTAAHCFGTAKSSVQAYEAPPAQWFAWGCMVWAWEGFLRRCGRGAGDWHLRHGGTVFGKLQSQTQRPWALGGLVFGFQDSRFLEQEGHRLDGCLAAAFVAQHMPGTRTIRMFKCHAESCPPCM